MNSLRNPKKDMDDSKWSKWPSRAAPAKSNPNHIKHKSPRRWCHIFTGASLNHCWKKQKAGEFNLKTVKGRTNRISCGVITCFHNFLDLTVHPVFHILWSLVKSRKGLVEEERFLHNRNELRLDPRGDRGVWQVAEARLSPGRALRRRRLLRPLHLDVRWVRARGLQVAILPFDVHKINRFLTHPPPLVTITIGQLMRTIAYGVTHSAPYGRYMFKEPEIMVCKSCEGGPKQGQAVRISRTRKKFHPNMYPPIFQAL